MSADTMVTDNVPTMQRIVYGGLARSFEVVSSEGFMDKLIAFGFTLLVFVSAYMIEALPNTLASIETPLEPMQGKETIATNKKNDNVQECFYGSDHALEPFYEVTNRIHSRSERRLAPITSSLRKIYTYLRNTIGGLAMFRGIHLAMLIVAWELVTTHFARAFMMRTLSYYLTPAVPSAYLLAIAKIFQEVLNIPVNLIWLHHILSFDAYAVSQMGRRSSMVGAWAKQRNLPIPRLPSWWAIRQLLVPTICAAGLEEVRHLVPLAPLATTFAPFIPSGLTNSFYFIELASDRLITSVIFRLVQVLLIRVRASVLPDDVRSLIRFDRKFGAQIPFGTRRGITLVEAFNSLSWNDVKRIMHIFITSQLCWFAVAFAESVLIYIDIRAHRH